MILLSDVSYMQFAVLENIKSAFIRNKPMSESLRLEAGDNMLLAVFHGPVVPSGPYFFAVLLG